MIMSMTLREKVVQELRHAWPNTLDNSTLAIRLGANEPSVRRITKQLAASKVATVFDYMVPFEYQFNKPHVF